nr:nitroreductase [Saprospiraceae bacterium]
MSVKTVFQAIRQRQSVFPNLYTEELINEEKIQALLELANTAPTHRLTEPWRFVVFKGKGREKLSQFMSGEYRKNNPDSTFSEVKFQKRKVKPLQSSHIIAVIMHRDPQERVPEWEEIAAVSCAVQNMWIGACAMGLGCYWSSPGEMVGRPEILELQRNERALGLFYLGNTTLDQVLPKVRQPIDSKVRYIG